MSRNISLIIFISMLFSVSAFAQFDVPTLDMKIPVFKSVTYYASSVPGDELYEIPYSISNNQFYLESLRLNGLAVETYDYGDYESSAIFANEAYRYALRSDEYVAIQLVSENQRMLAWADTNNINEIFTNAYNESQAYYEASLYALISEKWNESVMLSINSIEILAALVLPEGIGPIPIEGIIGQQTAAQTADQSAGQATGAAENQTQTAGVVTDPDKDGTAGAVTGQNEIQTITAGADQTGGAALSVLTQITIRPLPSQYTVRTWAVERDCLWTIAGYPWVFNDPYRWPELYDANKSRMPQPNNPDLIYPGFIINIPSNRGEYRQGMWDPNADYGF